MVNNQIQLEIFKLIKEIAQEIKQVYTATLKPPYLSKKNRPRADTSKYCQTHRASNYSSSDCKCRVLGYKEDTTVNNKKGGLTAYCA